MNNPLTNKLIDPKTLHKLLRRGVSEIIVEEEFVRLLQEGKPLRLKMGFDPTRPDIHLGHTVGLRKLRQLQELGHQVILIVGNWTAQIGDPSGQSVTRPMLTAEEVRANAETYMRQFFKVIDQERTQTVWQSEWFGSFTLSNVFDLTRRFTVAQFLARDDFAKRFSAQRPIAITELLYPLLQAYDSVAIHSDVEFGGSDQRFNLLVGRDLQAMMGQRPQQCFIMPILVGTDGVQKMSKSLGNYIGVEEPPEEMYGKLMSIPDAAMMDYFELLTDVPDEELAEMRRALEAQSVNPMELKKRLAREVVEQIHGDAASRQAEEHFERTHQRRETPEEITEVFIISPTDLSRFLVTASLATSRTQARQLIAQGAVDINGSTETNPLAVPKSNDIVRVGKHGFVKVLIGQPRFPA
ncbi:MAG: tyrosyl-tRNA synthetase [Dehalococcoidia bacterium]|nr:tyrosyl-tRNA synthetase [Dehalococcoidia bacterium]